MRKNKEGTVCDTIWKIPFEDKGGETEITLHIYNKPKTKKESKSLVQGRFQSLTCIYVFTELPKIYKKVCEERKNPLLKNFQRKV